MHALKHQCLCVAVLPVHWQSTLLMPESWHQTQHIVQQAGSPRDSPQVTLL